MFLDGLEIPGDAPKVATFHRNGGNFGPEWVATFKRNSGKFVLDYATPSINSPKMAKSWLQIWSQIGVNRVKVKVLDVCVWCH